MSNKFKLCITALFMHIFATQQLAYQVKTHQGPNNLIYGCLNALLKAPTKIENGKIYLGLDPKDQLAPFLFIRTKKGKMHHATVLGKPTREKVFPLDLLFKPGALKTTNQSLIKKIVGLKNLLLVKPGVVSTETCKFTSTRLRWKNNAIKQKRNLFKK